MLLFDLFIAGLTIEIVALALDTIFWGHGLVSYHRLQLGNVGGDSILLLFVAINSLITVDPA